MKKMHNSPRARSTPDVELNYYFDEASRSFKFGWIERMQAYLSDVVDEYEKIWSALRDMKILSEKKNVRFSSKNRRRIILALKRIIAFNRKVKRARIRNEIVGVGDSLDEAFLQLDSLTETARLMRRVAADS